MPDLNITIVLPSGGARTAEIPDDVSLHDLMPELTSLLDLPTVGPDGRPMGYRLDSKALGRELKESETLAAAGVPENDRLMLTADITAGGIISVGGSPRMRRLKADYELMQDLNSRSDLISFKVVDARAGVPPERYIVTFTCKSISNVDRAGNPKFSNHHQVEIYLHQQYPQRWPGMKWLTPIWHPNINHLNGTVCIDAAWWTASRSLDFGASGFIPKRFGVETLRDAILKVMDGDVWVPQDTDLSSANDPDMTKLRDRLVTLTPQQVRVLMMLSEGLLNKQIAYELGVSEATIKAHVSAILQKLGVESRTQAVIAAAKIELGQWPQPAGLGS